MRWIGSAVLILAAASFMFQGFHSMEPLSRQWAFLFVTGSLCGAGVAARHWGERNGAFTFFGLAAATLPVHFSQLAAMILSLVREAPLDLPRWMVVSAGRESLLLVGLSSAAVLIPVAQLSFRHFAGRDAWILTTLFTLFSAAVLLPTRDPTQIAWLLFGLRIVSMVFEARFLEFHRSMSNAAKGMVRSLFAIPLLILIGRQFFYTTDALFSSVLMGYLAVAFFHTLPRLTHSVEIKVVLQGLGVFLGSAAYCFATYGLFDRFAWYKAHDFAVTFLGTSVLVFVMGSYAIGARIYRLLGCIMAGLYVSRHVVRIFDQSPWVLLALVGLIVLAGASFLEVRSKKATKPKSS